MTLLPLNVFGLPQHQLETVIGEVNRDFEYDLESSNSLPEETVHDDKYTYGTFTTMSQLSKSEVASATKLFIVVNHGKSMIESYYTNNIDIMFALLEDLVQAKHDDDTSAIRSTCLKIKNESMAVLEDTSSMRT